MKGLIGNIVFTLILVFVISLISINMLNFQMKEKIDDWRHVHMAMFTASYLSGKERIGHYGAGEVYTEDEMMDILRSIVAVGEGREVDGLAGYSARAFLVEPDSLSYDELKKLYGTREKYGSIWYGFYGLPVISGGKYYILEVALTPREDELIGEAYYEFRQRVEGVDPEVLKAFGG